jgi:hypothetical protein
MKYLPGVPKNNIKMVRNKFLNGWGVIIVSNEPELINSSVLVEENEIYGYGLIEGQQPGTNISYAGVLDNATVRHNTITDRFPSVAYDGFHDYKLWRLAGQKSIREAPNTDEFGSIENVWQLSQFPRFAGSGNTVYRCLSRSNPRLDYPSHDITCGGNDILHSVMGFSYAPDDPGMRPVYHCARRSNHFVSHFASCEGAANLGVLAFVPQ